MFLILKHHCRICLKIYCYYCCNNWIEYNNSKLRVCKKCSETRENVNKIKNIFNDGASASTSTRNENFGEDCEEGDGEDDDDDDDDPDINFEVRAEKLNSEDDLYSNIYDREHIKSEIASTSANMSNKAAHSNSLQNSIGTII